jgi:hypothetical protein
LALGALTRGKDFQICPGEGCERVVQLAEACNQMSCLCGVSFCYVCGKKAEASSDHWLRELGGCPRWGERGSGRELFDDDDPDEDDDADDAGAEEMVPWERGDGESTTFNFTRWAWQAAMAAGTVYDLQLDVMFGIAPDTVERHADIIDQVRRAMEMYNPVSRSGVSEEEWQAIVMNQNNAADHWLRALETFVWNGQGTATEHFGGPLLDFIPRRVFNMAVAADREAGALWVREANERTIAFVADALNDEFPGSAVFDVGPGGVPGESWNIRDMDMFNDLPALGFFKLAGGALLVVPKPEQMMEVAVNVEVVPQPVVQNEDPAPDIYAADENHYVIIRAGQPFMRRRLDMALLKQTAPFFFLYAVTYPAFVVLLDVFIGEFDQREFDRELGLDFLEGLKIPGSWFPDRELEGSIYDGVLVPGYYSQDMFLRRSMAFWACLILLFSCWYDLRPALAAAFVK